MTKIKRTGTSLTTILSSLFFRRNKRFVTESKFRKNMTSQITMASKILEELSKLGVTETTCLKLEYFFYTDSISNAKLLAEALAEKGYSVEHGSSACNKDEFVVTGWTTEIPMNKVSITEWIKDMCHTGFNHDSDFDGWGTIPE